MFQTVLIIITFDLVIESASVQISDLTRANGSNGTRIRIYKGHKPIYFENLIGPIRNALRLKCFNDRSGLSNLNV